jgi:transcriptional regulator with XRE-family HTH domain
MRYTREYEIFCQKLVQLRTAADLTQRDMAKRLKIHHSVVGKMEIMGGRQVNVLEFMAWCKAAKRDAAEVIKEIETELKLKKN